MSARLSSLFISPRPSFHLPPPPTPALTIPLALLSCLHVLLLHTLFPKAPQPLFAIGLIHGMLPVLSPTAAALCPFPTPTSPTLSLPLFAPAFCPITPSSPSSLSPASLVPTSRLISYFPPLLSVCASVAKCYPFLLFSVCLCVLGPVLNPQLG